MERTIGSAQVRAYLSTRREIALLDVREENDFAQAHPLFAASLPLSLLELEIFERVPRRETLIVVYDAGEGLAARAAEVLQHLGYSDVRSLEGGLDGWKKSGGELFQDVNSASKAFGELVEARRHTPSIGAEDVRRAIDAGENMVILDARRFEEYATMSIPGATSVPGAELVLRANAIAPDPAARIVVNCAGRTRSIIGTQSLVNAGFGERVAALRNGTIGWTLAGLALDQGADRRAALPVGEISEAARTQARDVAYRAGVREIDASTLAQLIAEPDRTTYCFDVRLPSEYQDGHLAGFSNVQGGQLVQETDVSMPVRGARVVLHDTLGVRADMTASWLAQMGWEVYVLEARTLEVGFDRAVQRHPEVEARALIDPVDLLAELSTNDIEIIDFGPSPRYARSHVPGSRFVIRARLSKALEALSTGSKIVLVSDDGRLAALAADEVERLTGSVPRILKGGMNAWLALGMPTEIGLAGALSQPDDIYRRPYEGVGNAADVMQAYLDWEYGLVEQLERDATHGFFVI